ncbi:unnamed protein product [Brassicogethes aeneus]|uniref:Dystrophin n=1 Tax=Brassicogethes aeneus TaxID=1431903 RepID=A0A9P0FFD0_BRAAE|nr:unnamed protein product [Brassicogethes aeneus]
MTENWRKIENEDGFAYYINEVTNAKQWDHPKFSEIRQRLDECNYVKYSSYRVALKFRVLQQSLYMDEVPLSIIAGVFERHRLGSNESSLCLESCDLEAVLSDIYFAANKKNHTNTDIDYATELMLNFLYNVFDKERKGKIQVSSTKLVLALLSSCNLIDMYSFFFTLCADHNNCVTRLRLQSALIKLSKITTFIHEEVSFGQHLVNPSIENCFLKSPGLVGIQDSMFISWLEKKPQMFVWLPILHRIKLAETVVHSGKCTNCKVTPLMGLKYRCIKCSRFIQCQKCFFSGRLKKSHKLSHPMREYCTQRSSSDMTHAIIKKIFGFLPCAPKNDNRNDNVSIIETKSLSAGKEFFPKSVSTDSICNIEPLSPPDTQLQMIIRQLELQNRELQQLLIIGNHTEKELKQYLEEHRNHVSVQIQKLKILKDLLINQKNVTQENVPRKIIESTPMVENCRQRLRGSQELDFYSPIVQNLKFNKVQSKQNSSSNASSQSDSTKTYRLDDISTWIGGKINGVVKFFLTYPFYGFIQGVL